MKNSRRKGLYLLLLAIIGISVIVGCADPVGSDGSDGTVATDSNAPTVVSTVAMADAVDVLINSDVRATFSEAMDPATIVVANFTLFQDTTPVTGVVTYDVPNKTAIFNPADLMTASLPYTATITIGAKDPAGNAMAAAKVWTFTTADPGLGPDPVNLGTSGNYVILAKTAVTNVPTSAITGDIGLSPEVESSYSGFARVDATGYATSTQVTGALYAADMAVPTPSNLTTAVLNMEAAYTDAAGRSIGAVIPAYTDLTGETVAPGLYDFAGTVTASGSFTIAGAANDVWIFQIPGDLTVSNAVIVTLSGGAKPQNIFWQVAGTVTLQGTSQFKGIILCSTGITLQTGASMNGRLLAQTQVALDQNTVTEP